MQISALTDAIDAEHARMFAGLRVSWTEQGVSAADFTSSVASSSSSASACSFEPSANADVQQQMLVVHGQMREQEFGVLGKAAPKV